MIEAAGVITSQPFIVQILELLVAGGILNFLVDIIKVWRDSRRAKKVEKPELDGLVIKNAESAVVSMEKSLQAAERRIERLEKDVQGKDDRIAALEEHVKSLESRLAQVTRQHSARTRRDDKR